MKKTSCNNQASFVPVCSCSEVTQASLIMKNHARLHHESGYSFYSRQDASIDGMEDLGE